MPLYVCGPLARLQHSTILTYINQLHLQLQLQGGDTSKVSLCVKRVVEVDGKFANREKGQDKPDKAEHRAIPAHKTSELRASQRPLE